MTKNEAVEIFGGTQSALAAALGFTRGYISQWPDELDQRQSDLVIGAAIRLGRLVPVARLGSPEKQEQATGP